MEAIPMSKIRTAHVLQLRDGTYYIEEPPYAAARIDEAEIYFKYFDLLEAQARAKRNTQLDTDIVRISFRIEIADE
jgi:hypothetical protein